MTGFEPRSQVLEVTTLPTEPHHCPSSKLFYSTSYALFSFILFVILLA